MPSASVETEQNFGVLVMGCPNSNEPFPGENRAHSPRFPDFLEYQKAINQIGHDELRRALDSSRFQTAVLAFQLNLVPLGYAAFASWEDVKTRIAGLTPERLMTLIVYAAELARLPETDQRHLTLRERDLRAQYPQFFVRERSPSVASEHARFLQEMGDFAEKHRWSEVYFSTPHTDAHERYITAWLKAAQDRIDTLLSDRRFLAAFDAYRREYLSYAAILELVYGDQRHRLFEDLDWNSTGVALRQLAEAANKGLLSIPEGLREEFPDFYQYYMPELHGSRQR